MPPTPAFTNPTPLRSPRAQARHVAHARRHPRHPHLPARPRWTCSTGPGPGTRFRDLFPTPAAATVLSPSKTPTSLITHVESHTAASTPVLLGWLRHYGCTLCKKQAADWAALAPRLSACGRVALILIGSGPPAHAADFAREMDWKGEIFTDPSRRTYAALGFRKELAATFTPRAVGKVVKSFAEGNSQTWSRLPSDAFQQGGAVLVDAKGEVALFHADAFAGDHVDVELLYEEACAACKAPVSA